MYLCYNVLVLKSINMDQVSTYTAMKIFRSELTENPRHVSIYDLKVNVAYVILRLSIYIYEMFGFFFVVGGGCARLKG